MKDFKIFDFIGDIDFDSDVRFSNFINEVIKTPEQPILITINSLGGLTEAGFSIHNKIKALKNPVYTLITGSCSSIANIIFFAVPLKRRFAFKYTSIFLHSCSANITEYCTPHDLLCESNNAALINYDIFEILDSETSIPKDLLKQIFKDNNSNTMKILSKDFHDLSIAKVVVGYSLIS